MKISAHLRIDEHRGSLVNDVEYFYPMLPLAAVFWRDGRCILEIELPLTQGRRTLLRFVQPRRSMGDASCVLQDPVDRAA